VPHHTIGAGTFEPQKIYAAVPGREFVVRCKQLKPGGDKHFGGRVYVDKGERPPKGSHDHEFWFPDVRDCDDERDARLYTIDGFCLDATESKRFEFAHWLEASSTNSDDLRQMSEEVGWIVVKFYAVKKFVRHRGKAAEPPAQLRRHARSADVKQAFSTKPGTDVKDTLSDTTRQAVLNDEELLFECKLHYEPADFLMSVKPDDNDKDYFKFLPMEVLISQEWIRRQVRESLLRIALDTHKQPFVTLEQLVDMVNLYMCRLSSRIICSCATDDDIAQARKEVVQGPACTTQNLDAADDEPQLATDPILDATDFESKMEGLRRLYSSAKFSFFYEVRTTENGVCTVQPKPIDLYSDNDDSDDDVSDE